MSVSIPTAFVEQFSAEVRILSQQMMSKLRGTVAVEAAIGEAVAIEQIGGKGIRANVVDTRHGDTPLNNTPHLRRWAYPVDYDYADLIDQEDQVRMLAQPQNKYVRVHAAIMGREIDIEIIRALSGTAKAGKTANENKALPTAQKVTLQNNSTTVRLSAAGYRTAKRILDENEVDEMYPRFFVTNARGIENLLETTKVTSADYNTVRALAHGEMMPFCGFTTIQCERVPANKAYAYASAAACLKMWREPGTVADRRPDKRNAMQLYTSGTWGAVREEDEMVVELTFDNDSSQALPDADK